MYDSKVSDRELMVALVEGDSSALEVIISRWERPLFSFAHRYTQNEDATRDVVQETFTRIFLKKDKYDPKYALSSWLFTIAANLCKNRARWHRRHPEVPIEAQTNSSVESDTTLLDTIPAETPTPSASTQENEELSLLKETVMSLPHDLRTAILLHHYENMSYKEIAVVVGCSARGVETRLYRARKLLRSKVKHLMDREIMAEKKTTSPCKQGGSSVAYA